MDKKLKSGLIIVSILLLGSLSPEGVMSGEPEDQGGPELNLSSGASSNMVLQAQVSTLSAQAGGVTTSLPKHAGELSLQLPGVETLTAGIKDTSRAVIYALSPDYVNCHYRSDYAPGRYRTTVMVMEGVVYVAYCGTDKMAEEALIYSGEHFVQTGTVK